MEIEIVEDANHLKVEAGQIRYDDIMVVLIVAGDRADVFRAYILSRLREDDTGPLFIWNSRDVRAEDILDVYPHLAKATLSIKK